MAAISGPSDQQASRDSGNPSRKKPGEGRPWACPFLGHRTCLSSGAGVLLQLAPCPQVECNSKLDPTTTTFLKVRHPHPTPIPCSAAGRGLLHSMGSGAVFEQLSLLRCWERAPQLTLLCSFQMADSGGLPQVTQVRLLGLLPLCHPACWWGWGARVPRPPH